MTVQRLLKLLTLLSLFAAATGAAIWYQSGEAPDPWIFRIAGGAFLAAMIVGLAGQDSRPRLMLRFLAALFALIALIAFAADFSRSRDDGAGFVSTSLLDHIAVLAPSLLASFKSFIARTAGEGLWESVIMPVIGLPAFIIFAILAAICGFAGRPRREVRVFAN
jgi:hypothetical protein